MVKIKKRRGKVGSWFGMDRGEWGKGRGMKMRGERWRDRGMSLIGGRIKGKGRMKKIGK